MLPGLREAVREANDSLYAASKVAIAGNVIDFAALYDNLDVEAPLAATLCLALSGPDFNAFHSTVLRTQAASTNCNRWLWMS